MFDLRELEQAHEIVGSTVPLTPAHAWPLLAERLGTSVVVKHENHTPAGAFKVRGGLVYVDRLKRERPQTRGLISATRGNHGQSLAFAGRRFTFPSPSVCRTATAREKNRAMAAFGRGSSNMAAISRQRGKRRFGWPRRTACTSRRPSTAIWCSGVATYALELFEAAPGSTCSMCRSAWARASAALSWCAISWDFDRDRRRAERRRRRPMRCHSPQAGWSKPIPPAPTRDGMATRIPDADALAIILKGASRIVR